MYKLNRKNTIITSALGYLVGLSLFSQATLASPVSQPNYAASNETVNKNLASNSYKIADYVPSYIPSYYPTYVPSYIPSYYPTYVPSYIPSYYPTYIPSYIPSYYPSY